MHLGHWVPSTAEKISTRKWMYPTPSVFRSSEERTGWDTVGTGYISINFCPRWYQMYYWICHAPFSIYSSPEFISYQNGILLGCRNTLRPRQNGPQFADDNFKYIFVNIWISIKISPMFVPDVRINNIPAVIQIMAWRRPGDKPLSEPMMVSLLTHIYVTRHQWVNPLAPVRCGNDITRVI